MRVIDLLLSRTCFALMFSLACSLQLLSGVSSDAAADDLSARLELKKNDHISLVGSGLGERMQHRNHFETMLHQAFPKHQLTVRNLCFPGDRVAEKDRLRSLNFGSPESHLKHSNTNVILYFFGGNESFAGPAGLAQFKNDLDELLKSTKAKSFSDSDNPLRIVVVSPTAFEVTGDRALPKGDIENTNLALYTKAMKEIADANDVAFADIFTPTQTAFGNSDARMTLDGFQLSDSGYQALAPILTKALFGDDVQIPATVNERLKAEVDYKNFHWWHRYRAVNGYSIYGVRGKAGSDGTYNNTDVMERERAILDQMTANRDQRIWKLAAGETVPDKVDDSNTLPFINPKTNVGGKNDPNRKRGKLGSLDYSPAEEQQKKFNLADGYEINLFATEEDFPELANPVAMNFDSKGRMWVSTMPSYPHWKPKTKLEDKLLILTDNDGDGRADKCKVFADGLYLPTGFELGHGGVYVAQQPDVLFLKDTDGDDQFDEMTRVVTGLGSADSHHGIAAFEWGPDGGLYFNEGTFKFSQVESPYGLNTLGEAGIWRHDPRDKSTNVHVNFSFANPWGHVFDDWGQNFVADASGGMNYWVTPISGKRDYPEKHVGGSQYRRVAGIKKGEKYNDAPPLLKKRTRPSSGCELVSSRQFPEDAQGNYLLNNVIGDRSVLNHTMADKGAGFFATEVPAVVTCDDGNFRPVDLQFGPDGALYIVDWHNALIGHLQHNLREPNRDKSHGRIWRVTYKGRPLVNPPKIDGATVAELLESLKVPEARSRYRVRRELHQRDSEEVLAATKKWMASLEQADKNYERYMMEGLWMHQAHHQFDEALLKRMLESKDYRARAAATRVLSYWYPQVQDILGLLKQRLNDDHPRVRAEALRTATYVGKPELAESVLDVLNHDTDEYIEYLLEETLQVLE
ncbi:MAG: PVC-type heme-binding CxxCH protein [Planctomycetota bacterium]